ncbi:MAG: phosphomannomutase/phosphoglucomutase, partial [Pseudomonadota bacterium]|nr:phosphomannomutase/phosphoglucomutase [Pseudomonadota bacterium]
IKAVKDKNADIGIALDGDGDRLGVVDSEGKIIFPDRYLALMASEILKKNKSRKIVYDIKCSNQLGQVIKENNGTPIMTKTGHSYIKSEISKSNAILGGEMSGHIFYNDNWYGFDDGIFAALKLLEILSSKESTTHEVFNKFTQLFNTPEIKIAVEDEEKFEIVEQLKVKLKPEGYDSILIDGLRLENKDCWGLVRASNTTPSLILRFEANTEQKLMEIQELFQKTLLEISTNLKFLN